MDMGQTLSFLALRHCLIETAHVLSLVAVLDKSMVRTVVNLVPLTP